jgi:hypothetical protein
VAFLRLLRILSFVDSVPILRNRHSLARQSIVLTGRRNRPPCRGRESDSRDSAETLISHSSQTLLIIVKNG